MSNDVSAFPLAWPQGWPRTAPRDRRRAPYRVTFEKAHSDLVRGLELMDPRSAPVLSTDIPLRRDGRPYLNWRNPDDPGVAVYFVRNGKQHVIACDAWEHVKDNLRAVGLAVEAMRALERSGASGILDRAFSGFQALAAPEQITPSRSWWVVLGVERDAPIDDCERKARKLMQRYHPDSGTHDHDRFLEVVDARAAMRAERRVHG